jgi:hypothetical protein
MSQERASTPHNPDISEFNAQPDSLRHRTDGIANPVVGRTDTDPYEIAGLDNTLTDAVTVDKCSASAPQIRQAQLASIKFQPQMLTRYTIVRKAHVAGSRPSNDRGTPHHRDVHPT